MILIEDGAATVKLFSDGPITWYARQEAHDSYQLYYSDGALMTVVYDTADGKLPPPSVEALLDQLARGAGVVRAFVSFVQQQAATDRALSVRRAEALAPGGVGED